MLLRKILEQSIKTFLKNFKFLSILLFPLIILTLINQLIFSQVFLGKIEIYYKVLFSIFYSILLYFLYFFLAYKIYYTKTNPKIIPKFSLKTFFILLPMTSIITLILVLLTLFLGIQIGMLLVMAFKLPKNFIYLFGFPLGIYIGILITFAEFETLFQNKSPILSIKSSIKLVSENFWKILYLLISSGLYFLILIGFPLVVFSTIFKENYYKILETILGFYLFGILAIVKIEIYKNLKKTEVRPPENLRRSDLRKI